MFIVYYILIIFNLTYNDFASPNQMLFQDPATPFMEGIIDLHHDIMFLLIFISLAVICLVFRVLFLFSTVNEGFFGYLFSKYRNFNYSISTRTKNSNLEVIWTLLPAFTLSLIAIPSFALLYAVDEIIDPVLTLKVIGRQWNWFYEYSECGINYFEKLSFDSYMVLEEDLQITDLRLLSVDKSVYLPLLTHIRLLITSSDVLHCWAIPSLGIKMDAVPGRLNQSSVFIKRHGIFYGMCSEICGINHGFMPICIESLSFFGFEQWVHSYDAWILSFRNFLDFSNLDLIINNLNFFGKNLIVTNWFYIYNLSFGFKFV